MDIDQRIDTLEHRLSAMERKSRASRILALLLLVALVGCGGNDGAPTDDYIPMRIWTVRGLQIDTDMDVSQVSATLDAPLKPVTDFDSDDPVRGKGRVYVYNGAGHGFYFFQKHTTSSDEPTQPRLLTKVHAPDHTGKLLRQSGGSVEIR